MHQINKQHPTILIDALGIDQPGGGRTAIYYLLLHIFPLRPEWNFVVYLSKAESEFSQFTNVRQVLWPVAKGLKSRLFVQLKMPIEVIRHHANLVHFTKSQGAFLFNTKKVLTLFDMTILKMPQMHSKSAVWFWRTIQPWMARSSDAVVTLSHNAEQDIESDFHVPKNQIHVIYCSTQFDDDQLKIQLIQPEVLKKYGLNKPYFLFVGILATKKNLTTLVKAFEILRKNDPDFPPLVLAGPYYPIAEDRQLLEALPRLEKEKIVQYIGVVGRDELPAIYHGALAFLFPSIHEGFGIPCIEAMQCQTAVIASRSSAIPEVVGDGGLLIDRCLDPSAWADAIAQLNGNKQIRRELIEQGIHRLEYFSWKKSASALVEIYEKLI